MSFNYTDPDGQFAFALTLPLFSWGAAGIICATLPVVTTLATAAVCSALVYYGTEVALRKFDGYLAQKQLEADVEAETGKKRRPRFCGEKLGNDPTKCPEEGFEWRGKGTPESGRGNWHNEETNESLHPDLKEYFLKREREKMRKKKIAG